MHAKTGDRPEDGGQAAEFFERAAIVLLYALLMSRLIRGFLANGQVSNLALLPAEGLIVIQVLARRRATAVTASPAEWSIAVAATCLPLLATPGPGVTEVAQGLGVVAAWGGVAVQTISVAALGRSFGCVPANRGIKVLGPYRVVRHPIYSGHLLSHLGFLGMNPTAWNLTVLVTATALQIVRIDVEERFLSQDPDYEAYRRRVVWRLIPCLY